MNSGSNTASVSNEGSNDIRPTGPAGTVSAMEINSAMMDRSNASAFSELGAEFNATPEVSGVPDFVMKVAVTNNRADNVTLNSTGFVATLENDSTVKALNNMSLTIEPNATVFPTLGFETNGTMVKSVSYDNGSISFSVAMTFQDMEELPEMVTSKMPTGNMTEMENLSFTNLAAWNISVGGDSPMPLKFHNGSVVLALMAAENTNATNISLMASDFWLDVGNDTLVQADLGLNNNVPRELANNTSVPFLIGFRLTENMTSNGTVYFWPNQSEFLTQIPLEMMDRTNATPALALKSMMDLNATMDDRANDTNASSGNETDGNTSNASKVTSLNIELMAIGENATASEVTNVTVWTMRNGSMNATPEVGADNKSLNITVELEQGDKVTLLAYTIGDETKYILLRPLATRS